MTKPVIVSVAILLLALPAWAENPPLQGPTITAPQAPTAPVVALPKLTPQQEARVAERAGQIRKQLTDLSPAEQQAVMKQVKPARMPLSDAQRDALHDQRFAKTQANWQAKSAEDRAELREKMQKDWQELSPEEKTYRREKLTEKLKALPAADRQQVIDASQK